MPTKRTTSGASYAHRRPFVTAASIPQRTIDRLNEGRLQGAFLGAYQALADTFRSDAFTFNLDLSDRDRATDLIVRYIAGANDRAEQSFSEILIPAANQGAVTGREQVDGALRSAWHRLRKANSSSQLAQFSDGRAAPGDERDFRGDGTVSLLYPGSYPPQVPPRRQLLRIPSPKLIVQPTAERFRAAPQIHLNAVASLPLDLVTLIDDSQRAGIQAALDAAIRLGYDADLTGMTIANMVGLFPRWQQAVMNLGDRMTAQGRPAREVAYRTARYSDWLRERRGMMIARTELMTAMNTGRMNGWYQQADQGLLDPELSVKEWLAAPGSCDVCMLLNGTTVQGIEGQFDAGQFGMVKAGPCHPHCRCVVLLHPVRRTDQWLPSA